MYYYVCSACIIAVYVDIGANSGDTATLTFNFNGNVAGNRVYDIKVTQVECTNPNAYDDSACNSIRMQFAVSSTDLSLQAARLLLRPVPHRVHRTHPVLQLRQRKRQPPEQPTVSALPRCCRKAVLSTTSAFSRRYSICIRQEEGMCCVQYMICPDQLDPITATTNITTGWSFDTVNQGKAKQDGGCDSTTNSIDYISISESSQKDCMT